ncbi:hypothetical protein PMEGAS70_53070 [Priestia megaterium]
MNGDKLCYCVRKRFMQEQIYLWNEKTGLSDCRALSLSGFIEWYGPKVNTHKPKEVGTFTVENGKLIVADPAYAANEEDLQIILSNVKIGQWKAFISYMSDEVVESLSVFYGEKKPSGKWHVCEKLIAVDSAQAGIFDYKIFGRDDAIQYQVKNVHDIEIDADGLKYYVACADKVASDA